MCAASRCANAIDRSTVFYLVHVAFIHQDQDTVHELRSSLPVSVTSWRTRALVCAPSIRPSGSRHRRKTRGRYMSLKWGQDNIKVAGVDGEPPHFFQGPVLPHW